MAVQAQTWPRVQLALLKVGVQVQVWALLAVLQAQVVLSNPQLLVWTSPVQEPPRLPCLPTAQRCPALFWMSWTLAQRRRHLHHQSSARRSRLPLPESEPWLGGRPRLEARGQALPALHSWAWSEHQGLYCRLGQAPLRPTV